MVESCQIPEKVLSNLSTEDLIRKGLGMLVNTNCFCTFARKLTDGSYVIYLPHAQIVNCK